MNVLASIVNGVSEKVKASFKEKKILQVLKTSRINAEEALAVANASLEELPSLASDLTPEQIVSKISDAIEAVENAEATIARIDKIEEYLNKEVE